MQDLKTEFINEIVMKMYTEIGQENAKKLEGILYISLTNYEIEKKNTEIVIYEGDVTVDILKRFLISKKLKNCSDRTIKYYKVEAVRIFEKIGKNPMEVTADDLRLYFLHRQIEDKISATSINNEQRVLSSLFNWMQKEEIRLSNPMNKIDTLKEKKKKKEAFSEYELELMRSKLNDKKDIALFEVLVSTWARISEIMNIQIDEIKNDQILVHGKGDKDRNVYLTPKAQIAVAEYLNERNDTNRYLFPAKQSIGTQKNWWKYKENVDPEKHMDISSAEMFIRKLGKNNDIKAYPHKFRRTGATLALKRGMPLITVSKTLGHESIETTQIYLDISEDNLKNEHMKYC